MIAHQPKHLDLTLKRSSSFNRFVEEHLLTRNNTKGFAATISKSAFCPLIFPGMITTKLQKPTTALRAAHQRRHHMIALKSQFADLTLNQLSSFEPSAEE
jgi:hypothetical protein